MICNDWSTICIFDSDYSTRYRPELDLVLKDVNIKIVRQALFNMKRQLTTCQKPSEKIGVCGRTGAGKSSVSSIMP